MKILKNNIELIITGLRDQNFKGMLLYGSDLGVILSREVEVKKQFTDFEMIKLDLNDERKMKDVIGEILTPSFFGEKKFLNLTGLETNFKEIKEFLEALSEFDGFILITFPYNLDIKSNVRKLCEASKEIAVIPCFADEDGDIMQIVNKFLREKKLDIEADAIKWIIANFKGNRGILLAELEKLSLFKSDGKITLAEVKYVMDSEEEGNIFEGVNHFFSFNKKELINEIKVLEDKIPASVLISSLINYNFKLIEILEEKELYKKNIDTILAEKFIFFKQIPKMKNHLSRWNLRMLNNFNKTLVLAEIESRKNQNTAYSYLTVSLFQLASL